MSLLPPSPPAPLALRPDVRERVEDALARLRSRLRSAESRRAYKAEWERFAAWCAGRDLAPHLVTTRDVADYDLGRQHLAPASRARALAVLRATFAAFVEAELRDSNPADGIKASWKPRHRPVLTELELSRLLDKGGDAALGLAALAVRRSSLVAITADDVYESDGEVRVRIRKAKGEKVGDLPVPLWFAPRLRVLADGARVKEDKRLWPYTDVELWRRIKLAGVAAGIEAKRVTPHAIRRTIATLLDEKGEDVRTIQMLLMHERLGTTERYIQGQRRLGKSPIEKLKLRRTETENPQGE